MKKEKEQNISTLKEIKTISLSKEQIEKINNEEFEKCKSHFDTVIEPNLKNYEPTIEKVKYLINEMTKYLNSITPQIIYTSGVTVASMGVTIPLYLDRFIQNKITQLLSIDKLEQDETTSENKQQHTKLKWKATPALFGYIFLELAKKGYIDFPLHNGEINPTGLAKICFEIFEIDTTRDNLIKEMNENKHTLSDTKREKFAIPELKDLS